MREENLHRPPRWCMDQMVSGSGLYPPRLLADDWFTNGELHQLHKLENLLTRTKHAPELARDLMSLALYDIDVRVVVDNSASMGRNMFGDAWRRTSGWTMADVNQVFGVQGFRPDLIDVFRKCPISPCAPRWTFVTDALRKWQQIFTVLGVRPTYYDFHSKSASLDAERILACGPRGGTPLGETLHRVLSEVVSVDPQAERTHLILILSDGEANDQGTFNRTLDAIQDRAFGDVQVCIMGQSLVPEDLDWFEDEECGDSRIRTIEPW